MSTSFISNINKLANGLEEALQQIKEYSESVSNSLVQIQNIQDTVTSISNELNNKLTKAEELVNREATEEQTGVVKLAKWGSVGNEVIPASRYNSDLAAVWENLQPANTNTAGIVKIATEEEIANKTGNNVLTPSNINNLKLDIDSTQFYTYYKIGTMNYVVLKVSDKVSYLNGFGRLDFRKLDTETKFTFPNKIKVNSFALSYSSTEINRFVKITDLTDEYVTLQLVDDSDEAMLGLAYINIQALVDTEDLPTAPLEVTTEADGDIVTIDIVE